MAIARSMRDAVTRRACHACEYCRLPLGVSLDIFHIDHIVARQHGGKTVLHNLALCCSRCNEHKGPNLSTIDPKTKARVELFNPRMEAWPEHFHRAGAVIHGRTPKGRATVRLLSMNHPDRIATRLAFIAEGRMAETEARPRPRKL